jgi:hypothetical protein
LNTPFKSALALSDRALLQLAARLRKHQDLLKIIRSTLPGTLACRVTDCVVSGKKLILYSDSAAWTSQLRFHSAAVLATAQKAGYETLETVTMRILPPLTEQLATGSKPRLPAAANIAQLRNAARGVTDDTLQRALDRLGATLARLQDEAAGRGD